MMKKGKKKYDPSVLLNAKAKLLGTITTTKSEFEKTVNIDDYKDIFSNKINFKLKKGEYGNGDKARLKNVLVDTLFKHKDNEWAKGKLCIDEIMNFDGNVNFNYYFKVPSISEITTNGQILNDEGTYDPRHVNSLQLHSSN